MSQKVKLLIGSVIIIIIIIFIYIDFYQPNSEPKGVKQKFGDSDISIFFSVEWR